MSESLADFRSLSRKELHELVWTTPASKLAKESGISDVGLAKICWRHNIPRPTRGYWAKLANGNAVCLTERLGPGVLTGKCVADERVPSVVNGQRREPFAPQTLACGKEPSSERVA
jgi:hypothetical protein